jgi:hypothetical protein
MYNEKRNGNENVKLHPCGEEAQGTSSSQRTHPSPWKQTGNPLNQSKVTEYQPPDKGPSTLLTAQNKNSL